MRAGSDFFAHPALLSLPGSAMDGQDLELVITAIMRCIAVERHEALEMVANQQLERLGVKELKDIARQLKAKGHRIALSRSKREHARDIHALLCQKNFTTSDLISGSSHNPDPPSSTSAYRPSANTVNAQIQRQEILSKNVSVPQSNFCIAAGSNSSSSTSRDFTPIQNRIIASTERVGDRNCIRSNGTYSNTSSFPGVSNPMAYSSVENSAIRRQQLERSLLQLNVPAEEIKDVMNEHPDEWNIDELMLNIALKKSVRLSCLLAFPD